MEKEIDYEINQNSNKLVVRGVLHPKGAWAYVEPLLNVINDNESDCLDSVLVWLVNEKNESVELTRVDSLLFRTPTSFLPNVKTRYYLKAAAPDFPVITSSKQSVQTACIIDTAYIFNRSGSKMGIEFWDDGSTLNYYAYKDDVYFGGETFEENYYYQSFLSNTMKDEVFNGQDYIILDDIHLRERIKYDSVLHADSVHLILFHISEDLFNHFESISYFYPGYSDPYLDYPATAYSNINNGYGIFGSYNSDTVSVRLDTLFSNAIMSQKQSPSPDLAEH